VRENGGQYTHAACWTGIALAELNQTADAWNVLQMLMPYSHSDSPEKAEKYKVEPYVVAADIYAEEPHTGRGGWTWYTGSAGWYYRLCVENLLGITRCGNVLNINPDLPAEWHGKAVVKYRFAGNVYDIDLSKGKQRIILQ
jgi:cyclic beta-1,2-glucan synthetase